MTIGVSQAVKRSVLAGALAASMLACASAAPPVAVPPSLASQIETAIERPPFHRAFWSIRVEEDDGRRVADGGVVAGERERAGCAIHTEHGHGVGADGRLTLVGEEWTRGDYPRSFAFDPTGRFLYCCNQRADHVTVFKVNHKTGALTFTGHYAPVGNPSCVAFLDLKPKG